MGMLSKLWVSAKFHGTYAVVNPVLGWLAMAAARPLLGVGLRLAKAGTALALYFDSYIDWGIRKYAHRHGYKLEWTYRAAKVVERARALDERLNPRPQPPRPRTADILRGLTLATAASSVRSAGDPARSARSRSKTGSVKGGRTSKRRRSA